MHLICMYTSKRPSFSLLQRHQWLHDLQHLPFELSGLAYYSTVQVLQLPPTGTSPIKMCSHVCPMMSMASSAQDIACSNLTCPEWNVAMCNHGTVLTCCQFLQQSSGVHCHCQAIIYLLTVCTARHVHNPVQVAEVLTFPLQRCHQSINSINHEMRFQRLVAQASKIILPKKSLAPD